MYEKISPKNCWSKTIFATTKCKKILENNLGAKLFGPTNFGLKMIYSLKDFGLKNVYQQKIAGPKEYIQEIFGHI